MEEEAEEFVDRYLRQASSSLQKETKRAPILNASPRNQQAAMAGA